MAPSKRPRPSFEPPRPRATTGADAVRTKSKTNETVVSTAGTGRQLGGKWKNAAVARKRALGDGTGKAKGSAGRKGTRAALLSDDDEEEEEERFEVDRRSQERSSKRSKSKAKGRGVLALIDDAASDDEEGDEDEDRDGDGEEEDTNMQSDTNSVGRRNGEADSSPEPDMMLAEITQESTNMAPIPIDLIYKTLHHHFEDKDVRMKSDAKDLVGKYLEVFVREAVMRSTFEREEREGAEGGGGGTGFLEVEDLEKGAVQLCLDF